MNRHTLPALVMFGVAFSGIARADTQTGRATIVDGDTIKIDGIVHRLAGIDAPELTQTCTKDSVDWLCGAEAARALRQLIRSREVTCVSEAEDQYNRRLSACTVFGRDINSEMVATGYAMAYRYYSEAYVSYEEHARERSLGLWAGEFTEPWKYRREPAGANTADPGECTIKGNINAANRRLYHRPGDPSYSQTVISPARGERYFCSEEDAIKQGWQPAWRATSSEVPADN